ncbi:MAG: hypothetical protein J6U01_09710 [Clostridia bacterium]|nr:hypothetical protein [Clostridia bacterium]
MKKTIALILILALVVPVSSLALDREIDYFGGYAHIEIRKDNSPVMYMIYFAEDYTCYYLVQSFDTDGPGLGRSFVGTWGYTADGSVHAKIGNNTSITFKISSLGSIVDMETMQVYEFFDGLYH